MKMLVIFLLTLLAIQPLFAKTPIQVGGDEVVDACMSLGQVNGLSSGPDGFLAVKDDPNIKAVRIDKIYNKQKVWICEESKDGKWLGVVYPKEKDQECEVSKPIANRIKYNGKCSSGWVAKKYVEILAG